MEQKKWLIQRIDSALQLHVDWIKQGKNDFTLFKDKEISRYDQLGKGTLGTTAFIISIILGLAAIYGDKNSIMPIAVVLFLGVSFYFILSFFKDRSELIFNKIETGRDNSTSLIYYVLGYFHKSSMHLDTWEITDYEKFHLYFVHYVVPALSLGEHLAIKKAARSIFITEPARKHFKKLIKSRKRTLDEAVQEYEKEKSEYESIEFLEPLMRFGNYLLDYKSGKEIVFSASESKNT